MENQEKILINEFQMFGMILQKQVNQALSDVHILRLRLKNFVTG